MGTSRVTVKVELEEGQAWALAQFVKRLGWHEIRINAESEEDAHTMRSAIEVVQSSLGECGYRPR